MRMILATAVALGTFTSIAVAEQRTPTKLTAAQMDKVTAGALVEVVAVDVVDINRSLNDNVRNNNVTVAVPVAAAIAVLGVAGAATRPGRIVNRQ